ncbi:hypothetical protein V1291_000822 [Nitrobacteraceae bacterium AZCC 1564]
MKVDAAKELSIAIEIDQHDPLAELLWKRKWQLLKAADGFGGFVTTDDPVCLRWSDGQAHDGLSPGFGVEGTGGHLSNFHNPRASRDIRRPEDVIDADAAIVGQLNSFIISKAQCHVYAHDHSFKFMCDWVELRCFRIPNGWRRTQRRVRVVPLRGK